jgi:hypothetical protein
MKIAPLKKSEYFFLANMPWSIAIRCVACFIVIFFVFLMAAIVYAHDFAILNEVWAPFMLFSGSILVFIWLENREIEKLATEKRLIWRGLTVGTLLIFLVSAVNWPPMSHCGEIIRHMIGSDPVAPTPTPTPTPASTIIHMGGQSAGSGAYIGWILSAIALVIGFVVTILYRIAQDAKEQVDSVRKILDLDGKVFQTKLNLAQIDVIVGGISLLGEFSSTRDTSEKNIKTILQTLPGRINEMHSLLDPVSEISTLQYRLQQYEAILFELLSHIKDERFSLFLHTKLAPYLEALLERLYQSRITEREDGQSCIDSIERIWALARYDKRRK